MGFRITAKSVTAERERIQREAEREKRVQAAGDTNIKLLTRVHTERIGDATRGVLINSLRCSACGDEAKFHRVDSLASDAALACALTQTTVISDAKNHFQRVCPDIARRKPQAPLGERRTVHHQQNRQILLGAQRSPGGLSGAQGQGMCKSLLCACGHQVSDHGPNSCNGRMNTDPTKECLCILKHDDALTAALDDASDV